MFAQGWLLKFRFVVEKEKVQARLGDLQKGKSDLEKLQKEYEVDNKELREKLKELHLEFEHVS